MKKLLLLLLAATLSVTTGRAFGGEEKANLRIYYGEDAEENEFPFMVSTKYTGGYDYYSFFRYYTLGSILA